MKRQDIKIIIACEHSGIVRSAFDRVGFTAAVSCDLINTERPGKHIIGDIREVNLSEYHLMIAHPPCTYLTIAANSWHKVRPQRQRKRELAIGFVQWLMAAPVPHIALENPVGVLSTRYKPPSQIICPTQFGHPEKKRTCLWLKRLPKLQATDIVPDVDRVPFVNSIGECAQRWRIRSRTFEGVAEAMAKQWGDWLAKQYA